MNRTGAASRGRKAMLGNTKWFSFDVDNSSAAMSSSINGLLPEDVASSISILGPQRLHLQQQVGGVSSQRRGSFLYRSGSNDCEPLTSNSSRNSLVNHLGLPNSEHHNDEQIVTPFAQILQKLQSVRSNYIELTNIGVDRKRRRSSAAHGDTKEANHFVNSQAQQHSRLSDESYAELSMEILEDLDWCLDQLEAIQTHRSVGDLATTKFKRILNKELSHLAESSKSGSQISEYISNTFLDKEEEAEGNEVTKTDAAGCKTILVPQSPMSYIPGVKKLRHTNSCKSMAVSTFGVDNVDEEAMEQYMGNLSQWGIDVFALDQLTNKRSLTAITYTILKERDLLSKFHIPAKTLVSYLMNIEGHYGMDTYYHNRMHAADVTQSVHALLCIPVIQNVFTDVEVLSAIFASAIHDVDHPGLTNQHLINTNSDLALMYNDESILENHHLAVAFKLLQDEGCDVFDQVNVKTRQRIRRIMIDMVLATDMSKHMSLLADLKTMVETKKVTGTGALVFDNYNDRIQVLKCMLHCADLSNPTKNLDIYQQWTNRIMREFFNQGDIERKLGLDISPMCDRHTASVEKSQVGFIDYIVQPLWEAWAELVTPFCADILDAIEANREWYQSQTTHSSSSPSESLSPTEPVQPNKHGHDGNTDEEEFSHPETEVHVGACASHDSTSVHSISDKSALT